MSDSIVTSNLTLHLIDSARGTVVQTWRFKSRNKIIIGRSAECDIRLADAMVSRVHVEIDFDAERQAWKLTSLGRNGTLVDGGTVEAIDLADRLTFQLGPTGPKFRISMEYHTALDAATMIGDTETFALEFLKIDEKKKLEEVRRIVEADSFRSLREKARQLREARGRPP